MAEWVVPVGTALISVLGALLSLWFSRQSARGERLEAADALATRFREPLLQAAFNLETRLYNVVELGFLQQFLGPGSTEEERAYAVDNTLYVFAQYFCWVEVVRRESQFLDPRDLERNRVVVHTMEEVRDTFSDSRRISGRAFRLFRGEQRALGEVMLVPAGTTGPDGPRWDCVGYAAFVRSLEDPVVDRWFAGLRASILDAVGSPGHQPRLRLVHDALIDLIDTLDPDARRIPADLRRRLKPSLP